MTTSVQRLTNQAFGFPRGHVRRVKPVALACIHITGNSRTAAMEAHAGAQAERNYANRSGSNGPSAHYYVGRDGWAIEAVGTGYAAWSNGDVSRPHLTNPGVARAVAFRSKGYNVNEAYWLEFECIGFGTAHPITTAQMEFVAERIAALAKASGLPINRETVHGHWEINGVNRQNCPNPPSGHESFLNLVIHRANAILHPAPTTYTLHIAANALVRVATLTPKGQISGWTTSKWGPTASSAPCAKPVKRAGVSRGSATTALVKAGKFAGKHVGVAGGVTVEAT